jgi:hypothetical protein
LVKEMNTDSRFDILSAVIHALRFLRAEWRYTLATLMIPLGADMLLNLALVSLRPGAGLIEGCLWTLPAAAFSGWFMFLQARLIVFGERVDRLPAPVAANPQRLNALRATVITWMLVNMVLALFAAYVKWWMTLTLQIQEGGAAAEAVTGTYETVSLAGFILLGVALWALRFGVVHILLAVGYSVRAFVFRVNGVMVSLRFLALLFVVTIPFSFALSALLSTFGDTADTAPAAVVLQSVFSAAVMAVLNAAGVYALREMLARPRRAGKKADRA